MASCTIHSAKFNLNMENELDYHMKPFMGLDVSLLLELQQMKKMWILMHKYLQVAETIAENPAGDIKLVLRSPSKQVYPCRYNLPTGTDVAVIMPAETTEATLPSDVVVYKSAETIPMSHIDEDWNNSPMYDPHVGFDVSIWW